MSMIQLHGSICVVVSMGHVSWILLDNIVVTLNISRWVCRDMFPHNLPPPLKKVKQYFMYCWAYEKTNEILEILGNECLCTLVVGGFHPRSSSPTSACWCLDVRAGGEATCSTDDWVLRVALRCCGWPCGAVCSPVKLCVAGLKRSNVHQQVLKLSEFSCRGVIYHDKYSKEQLLSKKGKDEIKTSYDSMHKTQHACLHVLRGHKPRYILHTQAKNTFCSYYDSLHMCVMADPSGRTADT